MAKFCTKCGKPLTEGEVCSCQAVVQQAAAPVVEAVEPTPVVTEQALQGIPVAPQATSVIPPVMPAQAAVQTPPPVTPMSPSQAVAQTPPPVAPRQAAPQGTYQQAAPQGTSGMVPPPVASNTGQTSTMTKEAEWFNQTKDAFVSNTKNVFAEILPMLKTPKDTAARLAKSESGLLLGLELIAVKAFLALVLFLITFISLSVKLGNLMGDYKEYISLPWFRGIILVLIITIGADCLNAVLLKVVAGLFNVKATFQGTFAIVGQRILFDIFVMVVMGIMSLFSTGLAIAIVLIGAIGLIVVEYSGYSAAVEGDDNKKVYMYMIAKAAVTVVSLLLAYLLLKGMISGMFGSVLGNAMGGLGSSSSIFDMLY